MSSFSLSSLTQTRVTHIEKKLQCIRGRVDGLREEQESLSGDSLRLKEQVKIISKAHKEQEVPSLNKAALLYSEYASFTLKETSFSPIDCLRPGSEQTQTVRARAGHSSGEN